MFGWFNENKNSSGLISQIDHDVLARAASMLDMQLMLCKADERKYIKFIASEFTRGYLIGFFDASVQFSNVAVTGDEHFAMLMAIGHTYLFKGNTTMASNFALDSMMLQGNQEFKNAQGQGGREYFESVQGRGMPTGLMNKFREFTELNA